MAGPPKRNRKPSETSSDSNSSGQQYLTQEIQVDFEGRNPEAQDFHGIKQLLKQLFLKTHIDLSGITTLLIQQNGVGSVLKQSFDDDDAEEDDLVDASDVYGITSVLNLSANKDSPCVQELITTVTEWVEKCCNQETKTTFKNKLLNGDRIGLLINERFLNIPVKIADPLLTSLSDEINKVKQNDKSYDFDYFLMICKLHKPKSGGDVVYSNPEEQVFVNEADLNFEFNVSTESDTGLTGKWTEDDVEMLPHRRVLIFSAQKFPSIVQKVKQFIG